MNSKDLIDELEDWLLDIVDEHAEDEAQSTSTPAAPNSQNFRAQQSGKIDVVKNETVHGGTYSLPKFFPIGIKVGGAVKTVAHDEIDSKVKHLWMDIVGDIKSEEPGAVVGNGIKTPDGVWHYGKTGGTNWSLYGFIIS